MNEQELGSKGSERSSADRLGEIAKEDASTLLAREFHTDSNQNQGFMKILNELEQQNKKMTESLLGQVHIDMPHFASPPVPRFDSVPSFCSSVDQLSPEKMNTQVETTPDTREELQKEMERCLARVDGDPYDLESARVDAMAETNTDLTVRAAVAGLNELLKTDGAAQPGGEAAKSKFARFDKSGDGVLDKDEIEAAIKQSTDLDKAALTYMRNVLRGPLQEENVIVNPDGTQTTTYVYKNENYQITAEQLTNLRDSTIYADKFITAKGLLNAHNKSTE